MSSTNTIASGKNLSVETLRGVAILLVVMGHVIGSDASGGMRIDFSSGWRDFYLLIIHYIQMPLFTAVAGWVYAYKPIGESSFIVFMGNKVKRLLVPMAVVATIYFVVQYITPGTNNKGDLAQIWRIYIFPYTYYWYLQALLLIFASVAVADKLIDKTNPKVWFVTIVAAYAIYITQSWVVPYQTPNFMSFKGAMEQLPYFIAGMGVQRFGSRIYHCKWAIYSLAITGIVLSFLHWIHNIMPQNFYYSLLPLWLIPTLIIIMNIKVENRFFVYLGAYSYTIYLFHGFGTSGGRIVLSYLGIDNRIAIFVFATTIAVAIPVFIDKILSHNKLARIFLLGKKPLKKQST